MLALSVALAECAPTFVEVRPLVVWAAHLQVFDIVYASWELAPAARERHPVGVARSAPWEAGAEAEEAVEPPAVATEQRLVQCAL